ncbi:hypothetical protein ASPVEDRAFT_887269 [Aspergillus versicolor CBS 583.65]|uniref:FAD-binding PCMH-type domain-containing protein n=1 Tax=Aspergillus versicolor CBS 583.65 TaxID=1036611 RepID=A0A1L9PK57_ASPVE|nr:uncharacterized protein ASPVEDRAFT_887269 [Aspergillus versicolor CBS 583.65]OJJ01862.1 hypothetical protein ASPVEDRAFT_887269 [Aspergillus versicolor CBS 583.65]
MLSLLIGLGLITTSAASGYNCKPGQPCWPSNEQWESFNQSLAGNLHRTVPYAASCYYDSPYYDPSACDAAKAGYYLNQPRTDVYGAATGLNWESCHSQTCALNAANTSQHLSDQCYRGRLSPLYVDAHEPGHVVTAVQFAQTHKLRVSIKNTGHDYLGRSTSPDTLAIWTHNMNATKYHESFTASNCPAANGKHIGEMGAGAQAGDVYAYFQKFNMDVTGGNEGSVGLAGGFGQGGGHGVFGPSYGLMVDNAVEFDVVTADGKFRTINQCNDPDLFWAMRGGGGGTYAILTSYRFQLHPAVKINVYSFKADFTTEGKKNTTETNYPALQKILTQHATHQPVWSHNNISGHAYYWPSKAEIYLVLPSNNVTALKALTTDFSSFLTSQPDIRVSESKFTTYPTYTDFLKLTSSIAARLTPAGIFEAVASRLIPESLFESNNNLSDLINAFIEGVQLSNKLIPDDGALAQVIMTTPVNVQNGNTTSVNPAWRDALWHTIMTGGWPTKLAQEQEAKLQEAWLGTVQPLKELTPGGGSYVNEAHYLEPEWEETFFGENYPRLLEVKRRYDPGRFFDCWKCVGWEVSE